MGRVAEKGAARMFNFSGESSCRKPLPYSFICIKKMIAHKMLTIISILHL